MATSFSCVIDTDDIKTNVMLHIFSFHVITIHFVFQCQVFEVSAEASHCLVLFGQPRTTIMS